MVKVTQGPIGKQIADIYRKKTGIIILGYFGGAERNIITKNKPIWAIDNLKGLKMRTWEWSTMVNWWKALGAIPCVVAFTEVYTALQTGVVDGAENEFTTFDVNKWAEVCKYVARTQHNFTVRPLIIGENQLKHLPADLQAIIIKAGADASDYALQLETSMDHANKEMLKKKYGLRFTEPFKQDFIDRSLPILRGYGKKIRREDVLNQIVELAKE
ncbi:TRAP transporter substrate-binding protein [Candidatus Aerophobetes bacterium]|nr:TRAP transporter substrate-binding protein [Candidatus Aerophobetes bacterium]